MKNEQKLYCPISDKCGGCQYLKMPYGEQLKVKHEQMKKLLGKYGKVEAVVGMEQPLYYRHKVTAAVGRKKDGTIYSGVYEEKSHRILPNKTCYLENQLSDEIIQEIVRLIKSFKLTVYNEKSGYGLVRHIMVRTGYHTGQIMVILIMSSNIFPGSKNFVKALREKYPQITTIVQNVNDKDTTFVLGERDIVLYGKGYIEDSICGKTFKISPQSFYQVNPAQTEVLYRTAIDLARLTGKEKVIDAYCGTGTIGIAASGKASEVIGVELNQNAVRDAIQNAKINQVKNIRFYKEDAGRFMVAMAEAGEKADVVFMDPPRSGSDEAFLKSVTKLAPKKIVYVSCGPDTLARDLKFLTGKGGYQVAKIVPVDMFCFTGHCECVVGLQLRENETMSKKRNDAV